ncbi:MAG: phosphatidate cytidylyltransferase [Gallionellaceae bacterium]
MLKQRVITAIILVTLFLLAVFFLPAQAWALLVAAAICQGAMEWARLSKMTGRVAILYCITTLLLLLGTLWLETANAKLPYLFWYFASFVFWVLVVPAWMKGNWRTQNPVLMSLVGWLVLIPTGLAMIELRELGVWFLLGAMATVWIADIAAYFSGRKFGKHKLAASISPGKTWEGVYGALIVVSIYVLAVNFANDFFGNIVILIGLIVASWFWVGLAVIGDLFESAIKRQAGVKDSGALLPGHGGLLDRIDALTSTLPIVALLLILQKML